MKEYILAALCALLLCAALPTVAVTQGAKGEQRTVGQTEHTQTAGRTEQTATQMDRPMETEALKTEVTASFDDAFNLPVLLDGGVDSMTLHDYLVGAVLGEMPLSFEMEALKAQAIACRTYALRQYAGRKHDPAAVCTASSCCECWVGAGSVQEEDRERAEQAVRETDGLVLSFEGKLIEATFFSCSGGRTEAAADVWGSSVPYLIAVDSPGEESAPRDCGSVTLTAAEFQSTILAEAKEACFSSDPTSWIENMTYTEGGGVRAVEIGGQSFTGKQLRKLFGLNSTNFQIAVQADSITFQTRGYGHRVGMSQYGAQAMASEGAAFDAILQHYYVGASITDCRLFYP